MKKRTLGKLLFGFVVAIVMFGAMSCTAYTCPTYSKEIPVQENKI